MKNSKHVKQVQLAEILFENGMELPLIEKITGIAGVELLANKIGLEEPSSDQRK